MAGGLTSIIYVIFATAPRESITETINKISYLELLIFLSALGKTISSEFWFEMSWYRFLKFFNILPPFSLSCLYCSTFV